MQEDTRTELFADELFGHERPHFIATAVINQRVLHQNEASPWKHDGTAVDNEPKPRETRVDESSTTSELDTRGGGSIRDRIAALSVAAGVSRLDVTPGREQSRVDVTPDREQSRLDVSPGREQARADVTPVREKSRVDVTTGREQSRVDITPVREQSCMDVTPGSEQSRLDITPGKEQTRQDVTPGSEQSKMTAERGVAFDVEFQKAPKPRPPPRVTSRFRTKGLERKDETDNETQAVNNSELRTVNNRKFESVNNKELGAVRNKSLAFEVNFDDEPQSKRAKDEPGLLQSPFRTFRTRSNRRHQCQSSVKLRLQRVNVDDRSLICTQSDNCKQSGSIGTFSLDAGLVQKATSDHISVDITTSERATPQEDVKDRSNSKVFNLEKRNTSTLDLVSQFTENTSGQELPVVDVFDKPVSKEEFKTVNEQQQESNSELSKLQKRNTFTLDLGSEYTGDASKQGHSMEKALNELANKEESNNLKGNYLLGEHLQKRNTFTLDSTNGGLPIAAVLKDLASKEEIERNKPLSVVPDGTTQKRGTFTLDSVSQSIQSASREGVEVATVLNDLASREELKQSKQQSDVDTSSETSQKRSTFTLDCVSREIDNAIEKYFPNECANFTNEDSTCAEKQEASEKRSTYTLDSITLSLQSGVDEGLPVEEVLSQLATQEELQSRLSSAEESAPKRGTFTFESVSQTLEDAEKKGLSASEVLSQLAKQKESTSESVVEESAPKREAFTFESVSQTLEEAQDKGLPALEALHQLASEGEHHSLTDTHPSPLNPPQNRGTYTLDTVSQAIDEAVEKGVPVSVTLNHLAQEETSQRHTHVHDCNDATASEFAQGLRRPDTRALSPEGRDEFEASFEDALEQLEDCVTPDDGEAFPTLTTSERPSSEAPRNRGTFDLDDVSTSLQDGTKDGVPVVETLERLSRTSGLPKDGISNNQTSEGKRGTYTLDEVSRSLQIASEQGIPVVDVLQNLTRDKEPSSGSEELKQGVGKRGTYTLKEVSKSLEHAEESGIPVIDALEALSKDKPKSTLRLKIPDRGTDHRGTYTLDKVSHSLEHATQKGLPVVDALGQLTASKESPVHRRQEKLINRKTYALASPLETIGEGAKLRLYDGSKKQMMSPISFHLKTKEAAASKPSGNDSKARGVVQKLDFLTSACELLLEANAKEMVRDPQGSESTPNISTSEESVQGSHRAPLQAHVSQPERNTYSLESVSSTIDDAKAKGIPVVETLNNVSSDVKPSTTLVHLNSKSDSELINEGSGKTDRYTHSLENVSRTLEDAKKAGIPVIQALDQLTNELAEFSLTAMSGDFPITQLGKDNRKRKRYSETAINGKKEQSPNPSPIRKAYSLDDVAFAVQQAFQSGTSLTDFLDGIAFEEPAEPVMAPRDLRPRSVDSGFVSSFSDNDISSQSFESSRNRSNTFILNSSNEELDVAKLVSPAKETSFYARNTTGSSNVNLDVNRRTFTLDDVGKLTRDVPVIEALEKPSNGAVLKTDNTKQLEHNLKDKIMSTDVTLVSNSNSGRKKSPPKPKRQFFKKKKSPQSNSDSFVIEFFDSNGTLEANSSKFQVVDNDVEPVTDAEKDLKETENKAMSSSICSMQNNSENTKNDRQVSLDKHFVDSDMVPTRDPGTVRPNSKEPISDSRSASTRGRATWRPSGSVLDQIASLMDAAEDSGLSPADVLSDVTDLRADGEIEELQQDDADDDPVLAAKLANLRVQLAEKRRQIEAIKSRRTVEQEDQHRKMMDSLYWHVINKAQGGQTVGEGLVSEVSDSRKLVTEFPDQPTPPIAWSSPANSPLLASASHASSNGQQFETREFRLSDYPPGNDQATKQDVMRPTSQPAVELSSRPTPVPPRPSSHDPAVSRHTAAARKCWDVDLGQIATLSPLMRPDTASMNMVAEQETMSPEGDRAAEIEVENYSPLKKGLAMFIGDDESQGLTPEQEKKREKFLRLRQKKQEEDRSRKEAEMEKKRKREEKQHEKIMLQKMEEQRFRQEEIERQRAEQELRIRKTDAVRVPDSYATYHRQGPRPQVYDVGNDVSIHFVPSPAQPSGFAEFSGPQCYVKPSGKSNRKIIVNAISHVCLSGTVNQDQKEKCLQAISESDGHHFMILFKDGLKFRGIYVHNLDNDQLYKIFGIGPRVVTSKMFEFMYKYNSGAKEFTKIPSKTISISVDGFAIQKSCWSTGKPVVPSKTASNFKKPPRPPQR